MDHQLLESLERPETYPTRPASIQICQTHISVVALVDEFVYKLRKPVKTKFLDFSTLELRKADCEREVELNRRLAPDVYLGIVPVCRNENQFKLDGDGEVMEWAVKMRRLPNEATLLEKLLRNEIDEKIIASLAKRLAMFHATALSLPTMAEYGRSVYVLRNVIENFEETKPWIGKTVSHSVWQKLFKLTEALGKQLSGTIDSRASTGVVRDTHGDLHLDHIYWFPGEPSPREWVIIDCIEFNERFRYADPVADIAFVVMDLAFRRRRDLANAFVATYFQADSTHSGQSLLSFYVAYRAIVRAKVEGIQSSDHESTPIARLGALQSARAHWLFALGELSAPSNKPCILILGGLPGSGKSTLAKKLAELAGFVVIRSDEVRKEIAGGISNDQMYSAEMTDGTYDACLVRAQNELFEGRRVIIDANFPTEARRAEFLRTADSMAIPAWFVHCETSRDVACKRISERHGDASDATVAIYDLQADRWEPLNISLISRTISVNTNATVDESAKIIVGYLINNDLA